MRASKKYNDVALDGRKMKIEIVGEIGATVVSVTSRLGQKRVLHSGGLPRGHNRSPRVQMEVNKSNSYRFKGNSQNSDFGNKKPRGGFRGGRGSRGGRGRGGRTQVTPPTKEDLDAQLDAYNSQSMDTE
jgi:hypothetical protein